jgi:hypothetical protein
MNNFNILSLNMKRSLVTFSEKISKGLPRPAFKMITSIMYGIAASNSSHLSDIARALNEGITLKKVIDRLSRNLATFTDRKHELLLSGYLRAIKNRFDKSTVFIVDGGDITKSYSSKLEGLCQVHDGSENSVATGYFTLEITALTKHSKSPVPVYTRVYSSKEQGFVSEPDEINKGLRLMRETFGTKGIYLFDRGFDRMALYEQMTNRKQRFITRLTKNRQVHFNGETISAYELAKKYKGKYSFKFKKGKRNQIDCKVSCVPVSLPKLKGKEMLLVIVYGFGVEPMLLLTNMVLEAPKLCVRVAKLYLLRWRIEEYYRFKKQQYAFESFLVRSLQSIRALNLIMSILIGWIGLMNEKWREGDGEATRELVRASKRVYPKKQSEKRKAFLFYAIADGLTVIFSKTKYGISGFLVKDKSPDPQIRWDTARLLYDG